MTVMTRQWGPQGMIHEDAAGVYLQYDRDDAAGGYMHYDRDDAAGGIPGAGEYVHAYKAKRLKITHVRPLQEHRGSNHCQLQCTSRQDILPRRGSGSTVVPSCAVVLALAVSDDRGSKDGPVTPLQQI